MRFEPDPDHVMWYLIIVAALGFAMLLVGLLGEVLGWWNDVGEVLVTVGAIRGVLVSAGAGIFGAGRRQVAGVETAVHANGHRLVSMDAKLDKLDKLDRIQWALDEQTGVLTEIRDRL